MHTNTNIISMKKDKLQKTQETAILSGKLEIDGGLERIFISLTGLLTWL